MSYTWKSEVESEYLPERHILRICGEDLVFKNAKDATAAYNAVAKAMGRVTYNEVSITVAGYQGKPVQHKDSERSIGTHTMRVESEHIGTREEVENAITWKRMTKCDGTGICGCWQREEGHSTPEGWMDYVKDGEPRHMCPRCQSKEVKLEAPKVAC